MIVCILIPGFMIVGILIVTQDDNFREVQSFPQCQLRSRQSKSLGLQGMLLLLLSKLTCTLLTFPSSWILTIYLLREGRVRSLHTLYTLSLSHFHFHTFMFTLSCFSERAEFEAFTLSIHFHFHTFTFTLSCSHFHAFQRGPSSKPSHSVHTL